MENILEERTEFEKMRMKIFSFLCKILLLAFFSSQKIYSDLENVVIDLSNIFKYIKENLRYVRSFYCFLSKHINIFYAIGLFLYPLKT